MSRINPTIRYLIAVIIYGTIGLFLHFTNVSSEFVVLCRGLIGSLFIGLVMVIKNDLPSIEAIKKNAKMLVISGIALGLNWVFLFAGYRYGVAITSLCNYMAPIIVVVISAILFKEKLNFKQINCIAYAIIGIILVSGIFDGDSSGDIRCIIYGLLAAIGFVVLVLCNKRIHDIKPLDKTITQLFVSALTVLPYVIFNNGFPTSIDTRSLIIVLILGVVHTGIAYILYFNSIDVLPVDKVAILGYIEPVLSILTGALIFKEKLTIFGIIGAVLILSSALMNELLGNKEKNNGVQKIW